jgi:hypothetical protein
LLIPLAERRPDQIAEYNADLLLEGAAFAGPMAQQPPIRILPLAPDLPRVNVVGGHGIFGNRRRWTISTCWERSFNRSVVN